MSRSGLTPLRGHGVHREVNRHRYLFLGTIRQPVKRLCPLAFDAGDYKTAATSDWRSGGGTVNSGARRFTCFVSAHNVCRDRSCSVMFLLSPGRSDTWTPPPNLP